MKRVPRSEITKVRELRQAGKRAKEIALAIGVPEPRVRYVIRYYVTFRKIALKRPITQGEVARARELLAQGLGVRAVGEEIGRGCGSTLQRICILAGHKPKRGKGRMPSSYALASAYANGKSKTAVAAEAGVDRKTVHKACKRHKITTRPRAKVSSETIALLLSANWSRGEIARRYGLCRSTVTERYLRWKKKTNGTLPSPSSDGSPQLPSPQPSGS